MSVDLVHRLPEEYSAKGCGTLAAESSRRCRFWGSSTAEGSQVRYKSDLYECTPSLLSSACTRPLISSRITLTSSTGNPFGSLSGQSSRRKPGT
jgi:hypothetical protein